MVDEKKKKRAVVKVLLLFFLEEEEQEDAQKKEAKRHAFGEESSSLKTFSFMCIHEERDARLMSLKSVLSTSSFTFPKYETLYPSLLLSGVLCSLRKRSY